MDLRRAHEKLTSLAVSAMLTSVFLSAPSNGTRAAAAGAQPQAVINALNGLRAAGWPGAQEISAPEPGSAPASAALAPQARAENPVLTAAQQKVLETLMAAHGHDVALNAAVTAALGLSKPGEAVTYRQLTVNEHPIRHTYIPLPDGGYLLVYNDQVVASAYRLDSNFKLLAGVSTRGASAGVVVIPVPDAERAVQAELAYWAVVADNP